MGEIPGWNRILDLAYKPRIGRNKVADGGICRGRRVERESEENKIFFYFSGSKAQLPFSTTIRTRRFEGIH